MRSTFLLSLLSFLFIASSLAQKGLLRVNVSGVPSGTIPRISVTGPHSFSKTISQSETLTNLASGTYEFTTDITIHREAVISKAYRLSDLSSKIVVKNDTQQVNLMYRLMPGSDKIWIGNKNAEINTSTRVVGYSDDASQATQNSNATTKLTNKISSPNGLAFDRHGNLWVSDNYALKMFGWRTLGDTDVPPTVTLSHKDVSPCITIDQNGNLWISNGRKEGGKISRIPAGKLYTSGTAVADIELSGNAISSVKNIAFDTQGNLWANHSASNAIIKLNAADIQKSSASVEAAVSITCQSLPPITNTLSAPQALAFDRDGNLWVGFFGPNVIAMIPPTQQKSSATIKPAIQITVSVGVLLNSFAFDESGGLWTALSSGKFGKLRSEQLKSAGKKTPDVIITSPELKYATGLAFYPLPEGYPLH